ncbi:hypothetical protein T484DRAFT_1982164 [Baffinella frigidus]|nr:hypothetical protein T484DRAFT_1982164 [Cryptophyta sp. CCMP2293]
MSQHAFKPTDTDAAQPAGDSGVRTPPRASKILQATTNHGSNEPHWSVADALTRLQHRDPTVLRQDCTVLARGPRVGLTRSSNRTILARENLSKSEARWPSAITVRQREELSSQPVSVPTQHANACRSGFKLGPKQLNLHQATCQRSNTDWSLAAALRNCSIPILCCAPRLHRSDSQNPSASPDQVSRTNFQRNRQRSDPPIATSCTSGCARRAERHREGVFCLFYTSLPATRSHRNTRTRP